jgi:Tol biopolymer transport system component
MMNLETRKPSLMIRLSLLSVLMLAGFFQARAQCESACNSFFVHQAVSSNIAFNWTEITNPLTDGNPNAILFVTPKWGGRYPPAVLSIYNHPIGVWYTGTKWAIFNQDLAGMSTFADFNVQVLNACPSAFVHRANGSNTSSHITTIDHPLANNNPNAILLVTQNWNPGGAGGVYNNRPIGVYYNGSRWNIFNQNFAAMPAGASFNVEIRNPGPTAFVHRATAANTGSNVTIIDNPISNNSPSAMLMVTPNWNPPGSSGVYFNRNFGLLYVGFPDTGAGWAISTQDNANMTIGPAFNVKVVVARANNKIVFAGDPGEGGPDEIYLMNPDGSGQRRLTHNSWYDGKPAISSDGTRIAFASTRSGVAHSEIYLMNADGTGQTQLTSDSALGVADRGDPIWSPDGRNIAYSQSGSLGDHIYIIAAVPGSIARQLTHGDHEESPAWSRDGNRIAFVRRSPGSPFSTWAIKVINVDGTGEASITPNGESYETPTWSPDGTRLAFAKFVGWTTEIFVINADGSGETRLTNNTWTDRNPSWSADGTQIIFESSRETTQIWAICIDGSRYTQLTYTPGSSHAPNW